MDIDTEDKLVEKVGGKFKLTLLVQKRMLELVQGAKPLVPVKIQGGNNSGPPKRQDLMKIIAQEILEDKIELAPTTEVKKSLLEAPAEKAEAPQTQSQAQEFFGEQIQQMKEDRLKEYSTILKTDE